MSLKDKIYKFLWEIPAVVIAVLLALGLNTLKENQAEKSNATESLKAIFSEIETNTISIQSFKEENSKYLEELRMLLDSMETHNINRLDTGSLAFSFKILSTAVWETSQIKEISKHHGPEVVRAIAKIYNTQNMLDDLWQKQLSKITSVEFYDEQITPESVQAHTTLLEIAVMLADIYLNSQESVREQYIGLIES